MKDDYPQQETTMVSSIGGASAAPATYATTPGTETEPAASATPAAASEPQHTASAPTQSAESVAAARLGEQLNAEADASRVQRAVDESTTAAATGAATEGTDTEATPTPAPGAPAGGAGGAGGAAASETTDADYIAEADTNADKTVSDEERAAYEARLREQADVQAEVRAAYGQSEAAAPALDVTA